MPRDDVECDARAKLREVPALPLKTCDCMRHLATRVLQRSRSKRGDHGVSWGVAMLRNGSKEAETHVLVGLTVGLQSTRGP